MTGNGGSRGDNGCMAIKRDSKRVGGKYFNLVKRTSTKIEFVEGGEDGGRMSG